VDVVAACNHFCSHFIKGVFTTYTKEIFRCNVATYCVYALFQSTFATI